MTSQPNRPVLEAQKRAWEAGLGAEEAFWRKRLLGDAESARELAERARPGRPLGDALRRAIDAPPGAEVNILDVGSGPVSVLGSVWEGRRITIWPVDPLADVYNKLLDEAGIVPAFRPIRGEAERLVEQFGRDRFDMAFSHNALDHSRAPLVAIRQMVAATKPGKPVRLEHLVNEGSREHYVGLHQWNFADEAGRFIIWNRRRRIDVGAELGEACTVRTHAANNWISVEIRRKV